MKLLRKFNSRRIAALTLGVMLLGGCVDLSSPSDNLGRLLVTVKDDAGAGVPGIAVDLYLEDGKTFWTGLRTTSNGTGEFRAADGGLLPRGYIARIDLPSTYQLATGETKDKPAVVTVGQTATVNYKIVKYVIGGS